MLTSVSKSGGWGVLIITFRQWCKPQTHTWKAVPVWTSLQCDFFFLKKQPKCIHIKWFWMYDLFITYEGNSVFKMLFDIWLPSTQSCLLISNYWDGWKTKRGNQCFSPQISPVGSNFFQKNLKNFQWKSITWFWILTEHWDFRHRANVVTFGSFRL